MLDRFLDHLLHFGVRDIDCRFHFHDLLSARLHVPRQRVQNTVGIDFKLHTHARDAFGSRVEFDGKPAQAPVVLGPLPLALQHMNEHAPLMVHRRREHFTGFERNRGVARNDHVHQAAKRFDAQ